MDLDTKDHSLEIAALRTQSAISESWTFKFEELPPTVRHRIYRELLLMPKKWDSERDASYLSEHEKLSESIEGLVVEFGEDNHEMHPQIMRTNKRIHEEAAAVLYGENWFTWSTYGYEFMPIFHEFQRETTQCPRHYSRLITRVDLSVNVKGAGNTQTIPEMFFWLTTNLKHACKVLTLSDLKILKVDFYNSLAWEFGGSAHSGYFGERCLEPLKKCRAEKVSMDYTGECIAGLKLISKVVPRQQICFPTLCCGIESRNRRS